MMYKSLRWLSFALLFCGFLLASAASPARADGMTVSPPSGPAGTTFQIQAAGFSGSELVQLWTRYPSGRVSQLSSSSADSSGSVTFQVGTDSSFPNGNYVLAAHGTASGTNVFGSFTVGTGGGAAGAVTNTAYCQGQTFTVPGFTPGEPVAFTVQVPSGSVVFLGTVGADGSGNASFKVPLNSGLATGTYVIFGHGLASGRQTSDTLNFDGSTLSGANCSISLGGGIGGYVPGPIPKNILNYMGPGVYLGTNPSGLNYFGCLWKWRPMGGVVYFLVLGFQPNESVNVAYEILGIQGMTPVATIRADGFGNAIYGVNTTGMTPGHYHWWFTSASASYCGHYDHNFP